MIDFSKIDRFDWKYAIYNEYLRFVHNLLYYKEYRIVNKQNIPKKGQPVLVIANHQNGLTDALNLLYMFPDHRQPVFIARGDIFKKNAVAKILRFLKILPTFRFRDGDRNDVRVNNQIFNMAAAILNRRRTLIMFPEAAHQSGNYLGTFKKGFPRIAFEAEKMANFTLNLQILPVNIYYSNYYNARSKVLLTVGEPFTFEEFFDEYKTEPNTAYLKLNEKTRNILKSITLDEGLDHYQEYDMIRNAVRTERMKKKGKNTRSLIAQKKEDMLIIDDLNKLQDTEPQEFETLMNKTIEANKNLQKLKLRGFLFFKKNSLFGLLLKSFIMFCLLPLAAIGNLFHLFPLAIPKFLKTKIKDRQLHSSMNFAPSVIITFPLNYIIISILAFVFCPNGWWALLVILCSFYSFFFYLAYKTGIFKLMGAWRFYFLRKQKDPIWQKLQQYFNELKRIC
jgi:1-acyl-sn-glycerol-3-phosphate acyltransferase